MKTDPMAQHRAAQQIRDNLPAEFSGKFAVECDKGHEIELDDDRGDIAEAVVDQFAVTFERRVNEHGVAVRRVVMYGPEEVDPLRNAKPAADVPPALFEIPAAA